MKKMFTLAIMMVITITANAMSYTTAKNEALFLSDKMAYELNLTKAQYEAVYEINLDYLMSVNGRNDVLGKWWDRRNTDLQFVLTAYQYNKYVKQNYFYRPLSWNAGTWTFNIYSHYTNRKHFYNSHPTMYVSYKGGNNRKAVNYYADRMATKTTPKTKSVSTSTAKNNNATWRVTNNTSTTTKASAHGSFSNNHQIAQNSKGNSRNFGGRK